MADTPTRTGLTGWLNWITIILICSTLFTIFLAVLPDSYNPHEHDTIIESVLDRDVRSTGGTKRKPRKVKTSVQVVVLGDIGRSPRMQYHAVSIAKHGGRVDLIGYKESDVNPEIRSNPLIRIIPIGNPPQWLRTDNKVLFMVFGPLKVVWQVACLWYALGHASRPTKWMLVQNPPSIPTLLVAWLICFFRNTKLVVDWHNFGYSILALKLGQSHPLVKVSEGYEKLLAKFADHHFAVTNAMSRFLARSFRISALPLHDRPAPIYQPISRKQRGTFLSKLPETARYAKDLQSGATKLIVSSTSWTPDEDFSLLLDALVGYSAQSSSKAKLPNILAIITGKGPQKEHYLGRIKALNEDRKLGNVTILTAWLSAEDYAHLLGSADLGVSLHKSSSGVDLPMKVVDMFGTGLPVLGWSQFEAWPELVKENFNGHGFDSAEQLENQLAELLSGDGEELKRLREGALKECVHRWDDEWDFVAGKLFGLVA